jgi:hypothetical protein
MLDNIGGPYQCQIKLLFTVLECHLLYASPVWSKTVISVVRTWVNLIRPQRLATLMAIKAYRTVSAERYKMCATLNNVLPAGNPPISHGKIKKKTEMKDKITH